MKLIKLNTELEIIWVNIQYIQTIKHTNDGGSLITMLDFKSNTYVKESVEEIINLINN